MLFRMSKTERIQVRFAPAERAALDRVAEADQRPIGQLVRMIVVNWLRAGGHLAASTAED